MCRASRAPWQLARQASKVEPETLKMYTFSDFTLQYFKLIRRRLAFVVHSKGETAHRRKKFGQVRINSGQVDLSCMPLRGKLKNSFSSCPGFASPSCKHIGEISVRQLLDAMNVITKDKHVF